ncbi:MAG: Bcr/CflA family drug resistance efflux transporter [Anaerolineaceae bacterium]|nr:Bcr/CflA family drug resistance efflux transporter [Anaerolineaceae bacterium]
MTATHTPAVKQKSGPSFAEFVTVLSLMMSLTALSIDAMLPALADIGRDLAVENANDRQLVVTMIFLGLALGQMFFGPLSDKTGRKPAIYLGFVLYIIGSLISFAALVFPIMLMGRFIMGLGASSARALTLALVRDRYEGRIMARVMSFVTTIFILVPIIAPSMGQAVLLVADWRAIFLGLIVIAIITWIWFAVRIPETLDPADRAPFSVGRIVYALGQIMKSRIALGYTVSAGLIGGAFLGYISSAQQIFQELYGQGDRFPIIFGGIAISIGMASFSNTRLVMRYGMQPLINWSLRAITGLAVIALVVAIISEGQPPLWFLLGYLLMSFFGVGILFGNQNAMAMEPLGHLAGIGAAVVGSVSTLIQMPLGTIIGQNYNGTVIPVILGMVVLSALCIVVTRWAEAGQE